MTCTNSKTSSLVLSFEQIACQIEEIQADLVRTGGTLFGFHVKWNPQGSRILFVVRIRPKNPVMGKRLNYVLTLRPDGSELRLALPASIWAKGGHHPNWHPDGEQILQNINLYGDGLLFCIYKFCGTDLRALSQDMRGGGHPSLHKSGNFLVTDAYPHERVAFGDGTVPIRWVDLGTNQETELLRVPTNPTYRGICNELRVDPHPAWDRQGRVIAFNCTQSGSRRVCLAYLDKNITAVRLIIEQNQLVSVGGDYCCGLRRLQGA